MHSNQLKAKVFIDNFRRLTDSLWPTRCSHCISILSHTIVSSIMLEPKQVTFWKIPRMASKMCMKLTLTDLKPYLSIIYKSDVFQSWLGFSPSGNPLGHQIRSVNECSKIIARIFSASLRTNNLGELAYIILNESNPHMYSFEWVIIRTPPICTHCLSSHPKLFKLPFYWSCLSWTILNSLSFSKWWILS